MTVKKNFTEFTKLSRRDDDLESIGDARGAVRGELLWSPLTEE